MGWIAALRFEAMRTLVAPQTLALALLASQPLADLTSAHLPGARLVAWDTPLGAHARQRTRHALLEATEAEWVPIGREVARRTTHPRPKAEIGQKGGRVLHHYHRAKHCEIQREDGLVRSARRPTSSQREAALDGLDVLRTSAPCERLSAEDPVRG